MRTFIFYIKQKDKIIIIGKCESKQYPSDLLHDSSSNFYGCYCAEIPNECHVEITIER